MKKFIIHLLFTIISIQRLFAQQLAFNSLEAGDVLLISLNCYECRVIESETNSPFSHSGIVLVDELGQKKVAQSIGKLDVFTIEAFAKNKTPGTKLSVFRPREFKSMTISQKKKLEKNMVDVFNEKFKNAPFDSKYLWNNFNKEGIEILYCSEFIAKFIDHFLSEKTIPYLLSYKKHFDYWLMYFKGSVPEGELGNSPASFSRDNRFEFIGTL